MNSNNVIDVINAYLKTANILPQGFFKIDLQEKTMKTLGLFYFAMVNSENDTGVKENVSEIIKLEFDTNCSSNNSRRIYENKITELLTYFHLKREFPRGVFEMETRQNLIRSPLALDRNKSCDFKCLNDGNVIYCEVKDSSSELISGHVSRHINHFTPQTNKEIAKWIEKQINVCCMKGANCLAIRVPIWQNFYNPFFAKEVADILSCIKYISEIRRKTMQRIVAKSLNSSLHRIYFLKRNKIVKVEFI